MTYKIKLITKAMILVLVMGLTSCQTEPIDPALINGGTENNNENGGGNGGGLPIAGVMTATINGNSFVSNEAEATLLNFPEMGLLLSITGVTSNGEFIEIEIATPAVGTFAASNISDNLTTYTNLIYSEDANGSAVYFALNPETFQPTGTITISQIDTEAKTVSGTFSFTGYLETGLTPVKQISNGVFTNINYN